MDRIYVYGGPLNERAQLGMTDNENNYLIARDDNHMSSCRQIALYLMCANSYYAERCGLASMQRGSIWCNNSRNDRSRDLVRYAEREIARLIQLRQTTVRYGKCYQNAKIIIFIVFEFSTW